MLLAGLAAPTGPVHAAGNAAVAPGRGALFGAFVQSGADQKDDVKRAISGLEQRLGRKLDIDQHYYGFSSPPFPGWKELWDVLNGRYSLITWAGTDAAGINAGRYDHVIRSRARAVRALGFRVLIRFFAEMDGMNSDIARSPSAYVRAWRRVHSIFHNQGATNVDWVWCPTAWGFEDGSAAAYYPGDAYVDWICADGYNWAPGQRGAKWRMFRDIFDPFYAWGSRRRKPLMIAETGCQERRAGEKGKWMVNLRWAVRALPNIKAVLYFDSVREFDWRVDTSAASMQAFDQMADDGYFNPPH